VVIQRIVDGIGRVPPFTKIGRKGGTTELGDTPTPAGEEQEAFTVFFNPDLIGGTFVRLQATLPSEELTTIT